MTLVIFDKWWAGKQSRQPTAKRSERLGGAGAESRRGPGNPEGWR
jgi:hypothetical protein